jgi:signal transduction histidine kinase
MKFWLKVFITILLLSGLSLFSGAAVIIPRVHLWSVESEERRAAGELELMAASIRTAASEGFGTKDTLSAIVKRFSGYYSARGVWLSLIEENSVVYNGLEMIDNDVYDSLKNPENGLILGKIAVIGQRRFLLLSSRLLGSSVLVYIRDVSEIYRSRAENIRLFAGIGGGLAVVLALLAYLSARSITKPLLILRRGADAIAAGNYDITLKEGRDEVGSLARSFNVMTAAVREREIQLRSRAEERQLFIDDLSHEMNTPLTSIQGYAELLQNANMTDSQRRTAALRIRDETGRIREMYRKLMLLTMAGEHGADFSEISTEELFHAVDEELSAQLLQSGIRLVFRIDRKLLRGDRTLLHLLLSNLIRNSIVYSPGSSEILVSAFSADDGQTILEVEDHGIGIPEDKIARVTEPFYRVDKSRSRQSGGAGLGLSICRKIADAHGGVLQITSTLHAGTRVRMIFPG